VILGRSVVTREDKCCGSANDLLIQVDTNLEQIRRGGQLLNDGIPRLCRVCGVGHYVHQTSASNQTADRLYLNLSGGHGTVAALSMTVDVWTCDTCQHVQFFQRL